MNQTDIINNFSKKILCYKTYFQKNIFDEDFLDEKDKALTPFVLSDVIQKKVIKKSKKKKQNQKANFQFPEKKDNKYGSNIVYIGPKIAENDNDDEFHEILNEQIFEIVRDGKISCKNTPNKRETKTKL